MAWVLAPGPPGQCQRGKVGLGGGGNVCAVMCQQNSERGDGVGNL